MIEVGKKGIFYTLNGEVVRPDKFYGCGAFKFSNHIVSWLKGGGEQHMDRAKRFIENEVIGLGCRRMRAPIEVMLWGPPYFDLPKSNPSPYNLPNVANTYEHVNLNVGTGSAFHLTNLLKNTIILYVWFARQFDIVIEVPWLWTIKGEMDAYNRERLGVSSDPRNKYRVEVWNEHFLAENGIGGFLFSLKTQGSSVAGLPSLEPGPLNLLHDAMNEYTVHVPKPWDGAQLRNVARRWHDRDAKELLMISQSGDATRYDPPLRSAEGSSGYDAVCLHPPRDGEWWTTGRVMRNRWPNELIDVNESQLGMTQAQRDFWVPLIPKWAGLGSTDMLRWVEMHQTFITNSCYTTFHTFRGMDAYWPETPQTSVEEAVKAVTGGGGGPPPPITRYRYQRIIAQAYVEILGRDPDPGGLEAYDQAMTNGLSEADLRESLLRSSEYKEKNPD